MEHWFIRVCWRAGFLAALVLCAASGDGAEPPPPPVRLAVVAANSSLQALGDLLTAELSQNTNLALLERSQIDQVLREQAAATANRGDLALGRILGADGVLFLDLVQTNNSVALATRLSAVKPGIVLIDRIEPYPASALPEFAKLTAQRMKPHWPKLRVSQAEAIPISVVNIRASFDAAGRKSEESALKTLVYQRLTEEPRFFVLERERMESLAQEKGLNADDSKFRNGSYLLEAVVDQNGYSPATLTLDVTLTPPNGGAPLRFTLQGSRTNAAALINEMALKTAELLKIAPITKTWDPAQESAQFFQEAQWALKWSVFKEAQMAADAAWALGKKDEETAQARIKARLSSLRFAGKSDEEVFRKPQLRRYFQTKKETNEFFRAVKEDFPNGFVMEVTISNINVVGALVAPELQDIEDARRVLGLFDETKAALAVTNWDMASPVPGLGVDALVQVSRLLKVYYVCDKLRPTVEANLADLRADARQLARWLSTLNTFHINVTTLGTRIVSRIFFEKNEIIACKAQYGRLWQEHPEDTLALYRELAARPDFVMFHANILYDFLENPRFVAWNKADQARVQDVNRAFCDELAASTNLALNFEAKVIAAADAPDDPSLIAAFDDLAALYKSRLPEMERQDFDPLGDPWNLSFLDQHVENRHGILRDSLSLYKLWTDHFEAPLKKMRGDFATQLDLEAQKRELDPGPSLFQERKALLSRTNGFDYKKMILLFKYAAFTPEQARELEPLYAEFRKSFMDSASRETKRNSLADAINSVNQIRAALDKAKAPAASNPSPTLLETTSKPATAALPSTTPPPAGTPQPAPPTNANRSKTRDVSATNTIETLVASDFLPLPLDLLRLDYPLKSVDVSQPCYRNGALWLKFSYEFLRDNEPLDLLHFSESGCYLASWTSSSRKWDLIPRPNDWVIYGYEFSDEGVVALCKQGEARFASDLDKKNGEKLQARVRDYQNGVKMQSEERGNTSIHITSDTHYSIQKYIFSKKQWVTLNAPDMRFSGLACVGSRVYAQNDESIIEILDADPSFRILASVRRRPAVSTLDALDNLSNARLMPGPGESLRVYAKSNFYQWNGSDWERFLSIPIDVFPYLDEYGAVFQRTVASANHSFGGRRSDQSYAGRTDFWLLRANATNILRGRYSGSLVGIVGMDDGVESYVVPEYQWDASSRLDISRSPMIQAGSRLIFYRDCIQSSQDSSGRNKPVRSAFDADLIQLEPSSSKSLVVRLQFDVESVKRANPKLLTNTAWSPLPWGDQLFPPKPVFISCDDRFLFVGQAALAGLWAIPMETIQAAFSKQREADLASARREIEFNEQERKRLANVWTKYDANHDGVLSPEEKEQALADPDFIAAEFDRIDENTNGILDVVELEYFDANHNHALDSNEMAGINACLHISAQRLLEKLDAGHKGWLTPAEAETLLAVIFGRQTISPVIKSFLDRDHNGMVDLSEIEAQLQSTLKSTLMLANNSLAPRASGPRPPPMSPLEPLIGYYWTNHPSTQSPKP